MGHWKNPVRNPRDRRLDYWPVPASRWPDEEPMTEPALREPEQILQDCAAKLCPIETSGMFPAIVGCVVGKDWAEVGLRRAFRLVPEAKGVFLTLGFPRHFPRPSEDVGPKEILQL